jgi:hypothetical protein
VPKGPIRRSQLIAPFGVGSLSVTRDGTSVITCGLDHWYEREDGRASEVSLDEDEFKFEEWRLQRRLGVDHFREPPDFRFRRSFDTSPNLGLTVPFLRFPKWHFCPNCSRLKELPLSHRDKDYCYFCLQEKKLRIGLVQVPFVAICQSGHLQDFPWREWVHGSSNPTCQRTMRLYATGGASLAAQTVECECGEKRGLGNITSADPDGQRSFLSSNLARDKTIYLCRGRSPWLGEQTDMPCANPLRGSLRNASNLYFADVRTALYLPRKTDQAPSELTALLDQPPLSTLIRLLSRSGMQVQPSDIREQHRTLLSPYTDQQVASAIKLIMGEVASTLVSPETRRPDDDDETAFRRSEYVTLTSPRNEAQLLVTAMNRAQYEEPIPQHFSKIMLAHKLRETRAFTGFTRIFANNDQPVEARRRLLRRGSAPQRDWLPAYKVYGEGILFEFDEPRLREWESRQGVIARFRGLNQRFGRNQSGGTRTSITVVPRMVLIHTFSHLLMNRLTFECGYSTAALRERLYISNVAEAPMGGVLIYTAAGDAEGTLGGLVRMGRLGYLEPVIRRALETAQWCSADPVCMEMGRKSGQGPDSCNLAACHSCALVPETACEHFNRFLDRATVIGEPEAPSLGFFTQHEVLG